MQLKIGDFGTATKIEHLGEKKRSFCGTPNYMAPEVLNEKIGHSYEADVWAIGVIIYTLLRGRPPFETSEVKLTYQNIRTNQYSFPDTLEFNSHAKNLIKAILNLDPYKRPNLREIKNHDFMMMYRPEKTMPEKTLRISPSDTFMKRFEVFKNEDNRTTTTITNKKYSQKESYNDKSTKKIASTAANFQLKANASTQQDFKAFQGQDLSLDDVDKQAIKVSIPRRTKNEVCVLKWVDYSQKYGLGYLLSNGLFGAFFNDSTKLVYDQRGGYYEYIPKNGEEEHERILANKIETRNAEIKKKCGLLLHFKDKLEQDEDIRLKVLQISSDDKNNDIVYVKKWFITKHATVFRLANNVVQVNFTDKTQLILSSEQKAVTYVNKRGESLQCALESSMQNDNTGLVKRFKYTKDILASMYLKYTDSQAGKEIPNFS